MSPASEPASPFLTSPTQEGEITRAVAAVPAGAGDHQDVVELADQRLWLSVYIPPDANDHWPAFAGAVAQRAALSSERLLPVVASGNADGRLYVAYELGAAVPLSAYRASSELSTQRCLALLLGISRALDDAVSQGSPPYAATPESIFVDARRGAVIGDLGVAREALGNPRAELDRHAPWVAPEVLRGEGVHARSPVYSFGALTYTMFTGAPPAVDGAPGGEHPRLSELRPDLPEALDMILAVAMAPDPPKRYGSAAEVRQLVNLVIYGASSPGHTAPSRFPRRATDSAAPSPARLRDAVRWGAVPLLALAAALAAGALAGALMAGPDERPAATPERLSADGLSMNLPPGWSPAPAGAAELAAHPDGDDGSGLAVAVTKTPVTADEQAQPVKLGTLEAWRAVTARRGGAPATVRYVMPTRTGKVVATCRASRDAGAELLPLCERAASTLRLSSVRNVPLATIVQEEGARWRLAAGRLRADRAAGLRRLEQARRRAEQALAAGALARVHERAERRFAPLVGGDAAVRAARATAAAYRQLGFAAQRGDSGAWNAARADVRRSESALAKAVRAN